ncbi:MAG: hypothetical protein HY077_15235 [Elusimicrobia bacterium]|nr:hypothetical protein [Elusimicrobiota bacterium]
MNDFAHDITPVAMIFAYAMVLYFGWLYLTPHSDAAAPRKKSRFPPGRKSRPITAHKAS